MKMLKFIEQKLKGWNKDVFGDVRAKENAILNEISLVDCQLIDGDEDEVDGLVEKSVELKNDLDEVILREQHC